MIRVRMSPRRHRAQNHAHILKKIIFVKIKIKIIEFVIMVINLT